jgi:hypothetical protein
MTAGSTARERLEVGGVGAMARLELHNTKTRLLDHFGSNIKFSRVLFAGSNDNLQQLEARRRGLQLVNSCGEEKRQTAVQQRKHVKIHDTNERRTAI